jgi:hypothetical protein
MSSKTAVERIHELETSIKSSIQNINDLKSLLDMMVDDKSENESLAVLHALRRTFIHVLDNDHLRSKIIASGEALSITDDDTSGDTLRDETVPSSSKKLKKRDGKGADAAASVGKPKVSLHDALEKFRKWLLDLYNKFIKNLLSWLHHKRDTVQLAALRSLFVFIEKGSATSPLDGVSPKYTFDNDIFNRMVMVMVCKGFEKDVFTCLKIEFVTKYDDVRYYLMTCIQRVRVTPSFSVIIHIA